MVMLEIINQMFESLKRAGLVFAIAVLRAGLFLVLAVLILLGIVGFFLSEFADSEKQEFIGLGMALFAIAGGWVLIKVWPNESANGRTEKISKSDD